METTKGEQLGAVYLKIEGLYKERFKRLTEGMKFYSDVDQELNDGYSYIENYDGVGGFEWLSASSTEPEAQLVTLDELEERLFPKNHNMKTPTTFKVSRQALSEVLPHVCSGYKDKINKLAQKDLFSNEIEVSIDFIIDALQARYDNVKDLWGGDAAHELWKQALNMVEECGIGDNVTRFG